MRTAFGCRLRELRQTTGVSLRTFARCLGVSAPYLSDVETGRRGPLSPARIADAVPLLAPYNTEEVRAGLENELLRLALEDQDPERLALLDVERAARTVQGYMNDAGLGAALDALDRTRACR